MTVDVYSAALFFAGIFIGLLSGVVANVFVTCEFKRIEGTSSNEIKRLWWGSLISIVVSCMLAVGFFFMFFNMV